MAADQVEIGDGLFTVDAALLGAALGLEPAQVPGLMRDGRITSRCEIGQDEDTGTFRLTFYHDMKALRLTVDAAGRVLKQARFATPGRGPIPG
jgi:hypothetical protein